MNEINDFKNEFNYTKHKVRKINVLGTVYKVVMFLNI